jgi:ribonuclease HII
MLVPVRRHSGYTPRRDCGLTGYERVLARAGLSPVAGIDEAGRGACAGPLVVAAVALDQRRTSAITDLADSKLLTRRARETAYQQIVESALAWHVVIIGSGDIDRLGLHVCNVTGMRRALAGLASRPAYVLTDGFPVRGLAVPALAMWKGDQVAACVAAASIVAKVTRDAIMREVHTRYPVYGFTRHKGYSTRSHMSALAEHGPCPEHRLSFANVTVVATPGRAPQRSPEFPGVLAGEELPCDERLLGLVADEGSGQGTEDNGPMVDLIGDHARLATAGLPDETRGA